MKRILAAAIAAAVILGTDLVSNGARAADILAGQVTSAEEGPMEGVLVTAQKAGSTMRVTVVTDAGGRYAFPASKLDPGHYMVTIPAEGYDLPASTSADLKQGDVAKADLKLVKTSNLENQLTNADWLASAPESPDKR